MIPIAGHELSGSVAGGFFQFIFCDLLVSQAAVAAKIFSGRLFGKFFTAAANPTAEAGWISHHQREIRDIMSYYRTRADHRPASYGQAGECGAVGSDCAAFFQNQRRIFLWILFTPGSWIVGEHGGWTNEDVVLDDQSIPQKNPALDCYPIANAYIALNEGVVADIAILSDGRRADDMRKRPDSRAFSQGNFCADYRLRMYKSGIGRSAGIAINHANGFWRMGRVLSWLARGAVVVNFNGCCVVRWL